MKLRPTKDKVLVRADIPDDVSDGGVALPKDRAGDPKDNPNTGTVIRVGESDRDPGIKKGDRIVFTDFFTAPTGEKHFYLVDMKNIVGVIED